MMWKTVGQKKAVSLFQHSLDTGRLAHAYLFVGPAHVGKMTLARDLASLLNCESPEAPCGECASCMKIVSGGHADVQEVRLGKKPDGKPQTEIGVEDIKEVQHSANLPPFEGKCKVFIFDGAEQLSTESANRLLKTLEEPASRVVFVLLTVNEDLVPATVVSRCQRVEVAPLPASEVESALAERWGVAPERAKLLSRLSRGCMGWAVAAIDGDLLDRRNERLDELVTVVDGDLETRFEVAARMATEFGQSREVVQQKLGLWLEWWRDLMLVKSGLAEMATNVDRVDVLSRMARDYSLEQIRAAVGGLQDAAEQLKQNANARLVLEVLMLGFPERAGAGHIMR